MTTETISAHQWVLNFLTSLEAAGQHAPTDTMRTIMAEHDRMQNAINFASRADAGEPTQLEVLSYAARQVIAAWESGDLAQAVRDLATTLADQE
jgi:hypothetical protein